jgi:hypothetical protein
MLRNHPHHPSVLRASNLAPFHELLHGISTRHGGGSTGPYKSLNLSFDVGDRPDRVRQNYRRVSRLLSFDLASLVACQQIHHNSIALIDESYLKRGCFLPENAVPAIDGLATNVPGITLMARYADCVPLLFFNQTSRAVGIAHAGWKGTLARIGQSMIELLAAQFKCRPEGTLVVIGPSIGPCCYQVDGRMVNLARRELPPNEHCFVTASGDGRLTFDLWEANRQQLMAAGVQEGHIRSVGICTSCNTDLFFSYRREAKITGRVGAFIGLKMPDAV